MLIRVLRAKLHRAVVTAAELDYVGSITIDMDLADEVGMIEHECVLVADLDNCQRFETYVIGGERGTGTICINGAAARLVGVGHRIIVMAWVLVEPEEARTLRPRVAFLDEHNNIQQEI